jgi:hypothetical protein
MQSGRLVSPASVVLTAGTQADSTLSRSATVDRLQGAAARIANIVFSSSPVSLLFGADPDFEWFAVPDSEAGQDGATLGNVGYLVGGVATSARTAIGHLPAELARVVRGKRNLTMLGRPGDADVFSVVAADDIVGLNCRPAGGTIDDSAG